MSKHVKIWKMGIQSDIVCITIRDSLDTVVAYHLRDHIHSLLEGGSRKFLVNLEGLDYISSAGVGLFSEIILELKRHHGKIIFINISDQIYEVLMLTRLIEIFTIAETQEEALAALETSSHSP